MADDDLIMYGFSLSFVFKMVMRIFFLLCEKSMYPKDLYIWGCTLGLEDIM